MAKALFQLRYFGEGCTDNFPTGLTKDRIALGGDFFQTYSPIYQLGVQSLPGVKFYINSSGTSGTNTPIVLGYNGIYELSLGESAQIKSLNFDTASLDLINENESAYLIIDIIYESGLADGQASLENAQIDANQIRQSTTSNLAAATGGNVHIVGGE